MTSESPPPTDVNERVVEEWVSETTPAERVKSVIRHTYTPKTVQELAESAYTTPKEALPALRDLVEQEFATEVIDDGRALYKRSEQSRAVEQANRILEQGDRDEIEAKIEEMAVELRSYEDRFGETGPEEVDPDGRADIDEQTLYNWRTLRQNLRFAKLALALDEATEVTTPESQT